MLNPLVIGKVQIKAILRYHFTPFRLTKNVKFDATNDWVECEATKIHTQNCRSVNPDNHFGHQYGNT